MSNRDMIDNQSKPAEVAEAKELEQVQSEINELEDKARNCILSLDNTAARLLGDKPSQGTPTDEPPTPKVRQAVVSELRASLQIMHTRLNTIYEIARELDRL